MSETTVVEVGADQFRLLPNGLWIDCYDNGIVESTPFAAVLTALAAARREGEAAQQRCEWVATALHGDPMFGPGCDEPLVQQVRALQADLATSRAALEAYQNGIGPMGSKGEGCGEVGVSTAAHGGSGATQPDQGESLVAAPSPAPIPLGAVVEVDGVKWARTELGWNGGAWRYRDSSTVARVLTALYHARHPVATRETVERVAKAIDDADSDSLCPVWDVMTVHQKSVLCDMARAALTAAGFTLEEGA